MIEYRKSILDNGLTVLTHEAWDTPLAAVNLLYGVGSRNEDPRRTGFAHLFEHLMFGGTERVPDFDGVLSRIGGESNAATNCDYTDYYITLPAGDLGTALMLEADRMASLDITQRALEVQQHVVTEEYRQRYMNQPYGDVWLLLRPLCYKVHPYRWATIGADIRHVAEATLADVQAFHDRWYRPSGAVLAIAAPLPHDEQLRQARQAFGAVAAGQPVEAQPLPAEPEQTAARELRVRRPVPDNKVYVAWPMGDHDDPLFRACDLMTDILGTGTSSRLHQRLVRAEGLFSDVDACISGDQGPGLVVLSGTVADGIDPRRAADALQAEARRLADEGPSEHELQKVINRYENTFVFGQYKAADRAYGLAYYTWLGDTDLVNREPDLYRRVDTATLQQAARSVFVDHHENRLYYEADR